MRRRIKAAFSKRNALECLAAVVTGLVVALVVVSAAQAWVNDNGCRLHAYLPQKVYGTDVIATGQIDTCGGLTGEATMQLEVCVQEWYSGRWNTLGSTCSSSPRKYALKIHWSSGVVPGRYDKLYRSWTWGYVNGRTATYASSKWLFV